MKDITNIKFISNISQQKSQNKNSNYLKLKEKLTLKMKTKIFVNFCSTTINDKCNKRCACITTDPNVLKNYQP